MDPVLQFIQNNLTLCLIGTITLIQVAPIKIDPWAWLAKTMGKLMNGEIIDKIDEYKADVARYRIIRFDDEIRHDKRPHTEEHYDQILSDIDMYERYCKDHPNYQNNKAVAAIQNIKQKCAEHKKDNSFLV